MTALVTTMLPPTNQKNRLNFSRKSNGTPIINKPELNKINFFEIHPLNLIYNMRLITRKNAPMLQNKKLYFSKNINDVLEATIPKTDNIATTARHKL